MVDRRRVEETDEGATHEDEEDELNIEHLGVWTLGEQGTEWPVLGILLVVVASYVSPLAQAVAEISTRK